MPRRGLAGLSGRPDLCQPGAPTSAGNGARRRVPADPPTRLKVTPELLCAVNAFTWIDEVSSGSVAIFLIAHRSTASTDTEQRMSALAQSLGLVAAGPRIPNIGPRVIIGHTHMAMLRIDHVPYLFQTRNVEPDWTAFVADGGPVCVMLGLSALPNTPAAVNVPEYLALMRSAGRLRVGLTKVTSGSS